MDDKFAAFVMHVYKNKWLYLLWMKAFRITPRDWHGLLENITMYFGR